MAISFVGTVGILDEFLKYVYFVHNSRYTEDGGFPSCVCEGESRWQLNFNAVGFER
jgi:hypothetical protein